MIYNWYSSTNTLMLQQHMKRAAVTEKTFVLCLNLLTKTVAILQERNPVILEHVHS